MSMKTRTLPTQIFQDALARIQLVTGAQTQVQLAEVLGVRQSSISDAKRRSSIPAEWQLKMLNGYGIMPKWIMTGLGPQHVAEATPARIAQVEQLLAQTSYALVSMQQRLAQAIQMAGMTNEELVGHKRDAAVELQQASEDLLAMSSRLAKADMAEVCNAQ